MKTLWTGIICFCAVFLVGCGSSSSVEFSAGDIEFKTIGKNEMAVTVNVKGLDEGAKVLLNCRECSRKSTVTFGDDGTQKSDVELNKGWAREVLNGEVELFRYRCSNLGAIVVKSCDIKFDLRGALEFEIDGRKHEIPVNNVFTETIVL